MAPRHTVWIISLISFGLVFAGLGGPSPTPKGRSGMASADGVYPPAPAAHRAGGPAIPTARPLRTAFESVRGVDRVGATIGQVGAVEAVGATDTEAWPLVMIGGKLVRFAGIFQKKSLGKGGLSAPCPLVGQLCRSKVTISGADDNLTRWQLQRDG